jgi:exopolyphosphatase/guanosine-5'-triphosphate,3'-diphosphate pyrophosphatase
MGQTPSAEARDVAVIDVGSNSVRLVQFRVEGRAIWPVFNEKTMAGLGKGAPETGRLNPEGVESALRALKRFAILLDARGVSERRAVATAAVRVCEDGPDFVERVRKEAGIEIEVLSGAEEGRRSALGVLAGMGSVKGLTGDLGGSSLELTRLCGRKVGKAVSLPLGPLAVGVEDLKKAKSIIDAELEQSASVLADTGPDFYAVGGAWRAFAQMAMALDDYPLRLLHQYEMSAAKVVRAADFAIGQSEASLLAIPELSSKRVTTLPYAALLLKRLMKRGKFKRVIVSANGLREGVVCAATPELVKNGDPLLSGADALARGAAVERALGPALQGWIAPAFQGEAEIFGAERDETLRAAAARLTDIGARMHPDHRADLAFMQTLYAPFGGVSHLERAFLALAIHHRYSGRKLRPETCDAMRLLDESQREAALKLGLALRLGAALSGRSAQVLADFTLTRSRDVLTLTAGGSAEGLVVERGLQRFEQLAEALALRPEVR